VVEGRAGAGERPAEIRPARGGARAAERVAVVHVRVDPKARRLSGGDYLR